MAKTTIELDFVIGQRVLVKEIQRPGKVDQISIDRTGLQYRVAFWDNGDRKTSWVDGDELESR